MMKRIIAILLLVVIGMTMVACAPDACEECNREGLKLKKVKVVDEKMWLCPDCQKLAEFANALADLAN